MLEGKELALQLHKKGYNCAQAVACAYCNVLGAKEEDIFKLTEAFGFGMGTMGTCGAVTAMAVLAGLKNSDGNLEDPKSKKDTYKLIKAMTNAFVDKNKSVICRDIKGVDTGVVLRSCDGCIEDACVLVEEYLC